MNTTSYEELKKDEQELEQLKGKTYSLEDQACQIMKELINELDKKKIKSKKKKETVKGD